MLPSAPSILTSRTWDYQRNIAVTIVSCAVWCRPILQYLSSHSISQKQIIRLHNYTIYRHNILLPSSLQDDAKAGGRTPTLHGNCELCLVDNDFHIFTGSLDGIWYTRMTIAAATSLLWDRKACLSLSQIGQSPSGQSWSASDANNRSLQPFDL